VLKAQGPSRTCNESKDEEEEKPEPRNPEPSTRSRTTRKVDVRLPGKGNDEDEVRGATWKMGPGSLRPYRQVRLGFRHLAVGRWGLASCRLGLVWQEDGVWQNLQAARPHLMGSGMEHGAWQPASISSYAPTARCRKPKTFRGVLVFKAHRLLYPSTLGLRVIKNKRRNRGRDMEDGAWHPASISAYAPTARC